MTKVLYDGQMVDFWQIDKHPEDSDAAWLKEAFSQCKVVWHQYFETKLVVRDRTKKDQPSFIYGDFGDYLIHDTKGNYKIVAKDDFENKK